MPVGHLLVVAPNSDVRRSLAFVLEAEGFEVTALERLPPISWTSGERFDCAVLDQRALEGAEAHEAISFCIRSHPVVLLAAEALGWLVDWVAAVVDTPIVGNALVAAVRRAIEATAMSQGRSALI